MFFKNRLFAVFACCAVTLAAAPAVFTAAPAEAQETKITDEAQRIFEKYGDAIYQVQVVDLASDKKNAIGSGFQFTEGGLIATNYHVVAGAIQNKDNNRLEYLHDRGEKGSLKILIADVGHDLAILQMEKPGKTYVELGRSDLPKGARLFSLGNPHDIGFTIIEGTYNGVNHESFIDKIHFSGSLNPGMSGGPALGHDGKVVGVNVSTAGNSISFLVPVEPLRALLTEYMQKPQGYDFTSHSSEYIEDRLLTTQQKTVDRIMADKWESVPFGPLMVPGRINVAFKCWGDTASEEKKPYIYNRSTCSSQDRLFLDENFDTGTILYRYDSIVAKDKLNLPRFYNYYESQYSLPVETYTNAGEEDVTNFDCNNSFVDLANRRWKASFCVRQYKKYPKIYDMHLYMALVGAGKQGLMISEIAAGVSKENALKLAQKFMSEIKAAPGGSKDAVPTAPPVVTPVSDQSPPPLDKSQGQKATEISPERGDSKKGM
ncbi:MAG: serine protease [Micavibrio sp.]|nr:serine protease [Micavibrio sp.]